MSNPDPLEALREQITLIQGNALYVGKSIEEISKMTNKELVPFQMAVDEIMTAVSATLEAVCDEVIGEDEVITEGTEYDTPKWVEQENNVTLGANLLRAVQRARFRELVGGDK